MINAHACRRDARHDKAGDRPQHVARDTPDSLYYFLKRQRYQQMGNVLKTIMSKYKAKHLYFTNSIITKSKCVVSIKGSRQREVR